MQTVSCTVEQQVRFPGIRPQTATGKPAQVYTDDQPINIVTDSGDGVGLIENFVQDAGDGGSSFDVVLRPGVGGVTSSFTLTADADADGGETRMIGEQYTLNATAAEATTLVHPTAVIEPLP